MDAQNTFWYVLFVKTGSEEKVIEILKDRLDKEHFLPFILTKSGIYRRQGIKSSFKQICFRGYVFIQSTNSPNEFRTAVFSILHAIKDAYRFLYYEDSHDIAMREDERKALCKLFGNDFCLERSHGLKEGDCIKVTSGALLGSESIIKKINRGRKEAIIELQMFGSKIEVCVLLEVVEKI